MEFGQVALQVADPAERGRRFARLAVQHLVQCGLALRPPESVGFQMRRPLEADNGGLGRGCLDAGDGALRRSGAWSGRVGAVGSRRVQARASSVRSMSSSGELVLVSRWASLASSSGWRWLAGRSSCCLIRSRPPVRHRPPRLQQHHEASHRPHRRGHASPAGYTRTGRSIVGALTMLPGSFRRCR